MEDIFEFLKDKYKEEYSLIQKVNMNINGDLFLSTTKNLLQQTFEKIILKENITIPSLCDQASDEGQTNKDLTFEAILKDAEFNFLVASKYSYALSDLASCLMIDESSKNDETKTDDEKASFDTQKEIILSKEQIRAIYFEMYNFFVCLYNFEQNKKADTSWNEEYFESLFESGNEVVSQSLNEAASENQNNNQANKKNSSDLQKSIENSILSLKNQENVDFYDFFNIKTYEVLLSTLSEREQQNLNYNYIKKYCFVYLNENVTLFTTLFDKLIKYTLDENLVKDLTMNFASLLLQNEQYEFARTYLKKVISYNESNSLAHWNLCLCDLKCKDIESAKKSKSAISENRYYKLALSAAKKSGDNALYKKYLSYYDAQLGYRKQQQQKRKKVLKFALLIAAVVLVIIFNITFPIVKDHIKYKDAQNLKFSEVKNGYAVYVLEDFEQSEVVVPELYQNKPVVSVKSFTGCESLTKITLPKTITSISPYAFENCTNLLEVYISNEAQISAIGISAFNKCTNLTNLYTINLSKDSQVLSDYNFNYLTSIGNTAFANCSKLETINISQSKITQIPNACFTICSNLHDVVLPQTITKISENAFFKCESLKTITIPGSVKEIEETAFAYCKSLKTIDFITDKLIYVDNVYISGSELENIGTSAFLGCAIEELTLPLGVKKINMRAFMNNKITYLNLPKTVEDINTWAFFGNQLLLIKIDIINPAVIGDGNDYAQKFAHNKEGYSDKKYFVLQNLKVYVPTESYDNYLAYWENWTITDKVLPMTQLPN